MNDYGHVDDETPSFAISLYAVHTDLYDGGGKNAIPFDKLDSFFTEYLK